MTALPLIFFLIVLFDSWTDAVKAALIRHFRGAVLYAAACAVVALIIPGSWAWCIGFAILTRAAWFDPLFNAWARQPFTYNGDKNNRRRSFIDKIEDASGLSIFALRVIYIALWAAFTVIFYIKK